MKKLFYLLFLFSFLLVFSSFAQQRSSKRGVSYDIPYVEDVNAMSPGVSWFYNWGTSPKSTIDNYYSNYMEYYPMAWNGVDANALRAFKAKHPECKYLLTFNEPNLTDQANMTPSQAAAKWPAVKAIAQELNLKIVSPAMNYGTLSGYGDPITWLDEFFTLVPLSDIDAIAIHTYMNWPGAVSWYVGRFAKYGKPIWLTEFCAWEYQEPLTTNAQVGYLFQRNTMIEKVEFLELNPQVEKYAWFIPRTNNDGEFPYMQLLKKVQGSVLPGTLTELGQIYVNMSSFDLSKYYGLGEKIPAKNYVKSAPVQLESSTDLSEEAYPIQICNFEKNVFAEYLIDIPQAGTYPLSLRMACPANIQPVFKIYSNGNVVTSTDSVAVSSTGGQNIWDTKIINVNLPQGKQRIRIASSGLATGVKLQWVSLSNVNEVKATSLPEIKVYIDGNKQLQILSSAKVSNSAIYDLSGKILIQHNTCQQIDVHSLAMGIYLILIKFQDGYLATEKFVINE
ncbi:MAG: carbohydrate-binding protein [Paludibacteraceae bacterium]|nr:carbohydrate-binding protein [Paludibacteraceae bacterium]